MAECGRCGGKGRLDPCDRCDGKGEVWSDDLAEWSECSRCKGEGQYECPDCEGTGEV